MDEVFAILGMALLIAGAVYAFNQETPVIETSADKPEKVKPAKKQTIEDIKADVLPGLVEKLESREIELQARADKYNSADTGAVLDEFKSSVMSCGGDKAKIFTHKIQGFREKKEMIMPSMYDVLWSDDKYECIGIGPVLSTPTGDEMKITVVNQREGDLDGKSSSHHSSTRGILYSSEHSSSSGSLKGSSREKTYTVHVDARISKGAQDYIGTLMENIVGEAA